MSNYFKFFPMVEYKFGEETDVATFENISIYADVVDQVADAVSAYQEYYITPGERPDHASTKLYGVPDYHWTFYLMNERLREQRWPLTDNSLFDTAVVKYPTKVITTQTKLTDKMKVGQTITGGSSAATATIGKRNLDLGQLFLENVNGVFTAGENVTSTNANDVIETLIVTRFSDQYNAVHHYEDSSGETVDIDPEAGPGASLTGITYLDRLVRLNEANREIKVIKPTIVLDVVRAFREAVRN